MVHLKKLIAPILQRSKKAPKKKTVVFVDNEIEHKFSEVNLSKLSQIADEQYEPYDFGNVDEPLSYVGALLHFMKYIIGTGILAIPFAFMNVGYIIGLLGMTLVCVLYVHVVHMLLSTEYELCKRLRVPNLTYVEVVENTFKTGITNVQKLAYPFLTFVYFNYVFNGITGNASYLLIIGGNMKCVYDAYNGADVDIKYFISIVIGPLIALCWIPRLRFLIPFSMLTNIFNFVNIILILVIPLNPNSQRGTPKPYNNIFFFPQFFALVLNAVTGTGLSLPIKNDMAKPKHFASSVGVMNVAMLISGTIYTFFGFSGYLRYGNMTQGNVLLNLPAKEPLSMIVYSLYTIAVCVSFFLNFYICFDTIWTSYLGKKVVDWPPKRIFFFKNGLKTAICVTSYVISIGIPQFELFGALTGSFGILADICIPPLLQIFLKWPSVEGGWMPFKNCVIVLIGVGLCVGGIVGSVMDILKFYNLLSG